jgi:hypothetical protein
MDTEILDLCKERCGAAYATAAGPAQQGFAFDPTLIVTIVMAVFQACQKKGAELKAAAQERSWQSEAVVRSHVRREMRAKYGVFGYARNNGDAVVDAVFKAANDSSEHELDRMAAASA